MTVYLFISWQRLVHQSLHSNQKHAQNTIEIPFVKLKDMEKWRFFIDLRGFLLALSFRSQQ